MKPLLRLEDLSVTYRTSPPVRAVDGLTLSVPVGECLAIVGESGSGKSTLARSLLGLLTDADISGHIWLEDTELTALDEEGWRRVRWRRLALVPQSVTALNPVLRIGRQLSEPIEQHLGAPRDTAERRAAELLERVGLPAAVADRYPNELSGGQQRLVLIATSLACDPAVIVLDEPTAGLDPITRQRVLALIGELRTERHTTTVLLSHDLDAVRTTADRVAVLYRGWLAEIGPSEAVLTEPRHPYTWGLVASYPSLADVKDLRGIRGDPPDPTVTPAGCPFNDRCTQVVDGCRTGARPPLEAVVDGTDNHRVSCIRGGLVPVLRARGLRRTFRTRGAPPVPAVDGIDLDVHHGEVVGVVGPNGAGKSTLARLLVRLEEPDGGTLELHGVDAYRCSADQLRQLRRDVQLLFQDPYDALSPRLTIRACVREPLDIQGFGTPQERDALVRAVLHEVRLPTNESFLDRFTHQLSGGQLQRVALARALVLDPKLLVADEPFTALDPSEQAKALQLLKRIQTERGMAMVLISHDLAVVLRMADRIIVLDEGRIVEQGTGPQLLRRPAHRMTRRLLASAGWELPGIGLPVTEEEQSLAAEQDTVVSRRTS